MIHGCLRWDLRYLYEALQQNATDKRSWKDWHNWVSPILIRFGDDQPVAGAPPLTHAITSAVLCRLYSELITISRIEAVRNLCWRYLRGSLLHVVEVLPVGTAVPIGDKQLTLLANRTCSGFQVRCHGRCTALAAGGFRRDDSAPRRGSYKFSSFISQKGFGRVRMPNF